MNSTIPPVPVVSDKDASRCQSSDKIQWLEVRVTSVAFRDRWIVATKK